MLMWTISDSAFVFSHSRLSSIVNIYGLQGVTKLSLRHDEQKLYKLDPVVPDTLAAMSQSICFVFCVKSLQ